MEHTKVWALDFKRLRSTRGNWERLCLVVWLRLYVRVGSIAVTSGSYLIYFLTVLLGRLETLLTFGSKPDCSGKGNMRASFVGYSRLYRCTRWAGNSLLWAPPPNWPRFGSRWAIGGAWSCLGELDYCYFDCCYCWSWFLRRSVCHMTLYCSWITHLTLRWTDPTMLDITRDYFGYWTALMFVATLEV